jgi:hypothetical protein
MFPEVIAIVVSQNINRATPLIPEEIIWLMRLLRRQLYIQKPWVSISPLSFWLLL